MQSRDARRRPGKARKLPASKSIPSDYFSLMLKQETTISAPVRMPYVDALRAVAATLIVWHHFVSYEPLSQWAVPAPGRLLDGLRNYPLAVQVFFVVGGYVMARSMSSRTWHVQHVGWFVVRRYCRLGLPYLAAMALAIGACAAGRGWIPDSVVGPPPTLRQILAHAVFLQDILQYDSLSAGLWFVCIDFQLGLIYVALLYLRDVIARVFGQALGERATIVPMLFGWTLAVASLFFFNVDPRFDMWAVYFFGQFYLGVMVYHGLRSPGGKVLFGLYVWVMVVALVYSWRWHLATSLATGLVLFVGGESGLMDRWPTSRAMGYLGRTSYSLFLIHFPVLVAVSTLWVWFAWTSRWSAVSGLAVAYIASLVVAEVAYRTVEAPATRLSRMRLAGTESDCKELEVAESR
jgi:peptidoglycan/LPS O-acetylase OafA/YrhL